jgi:tetratricopeptide (TPR) repeat protein
MSDDIAHQQALILVERGHKQQLKGLFGDAIYLFRRSLSIYPTAQAYTFLGRAYDTLKRYDEAIECCKQAIDIDSTFGDPLNDIGAYLIKLERWEEAIPWLEKAVEAPHYDTPQFPMTNLGRIYGQLGRYSLALAYYDRALNVAPFYLTAVREKYRLLGRLN